METNKNLTAAELVAAWRPAPLSPRETALRAIVAEGNDRVTASIILDAREAAEERERARWHAEQMRSGGFGFRS